MRTATKQRRARSTAASRPVHARSRLAITLLALIAFTFQSFLLQTHIHGLPLTVATAVSDSHAAASSSQNDKSPADSDQANCPLCQEFQHAGAYVMPAAFAALPPTLVVGVVALIAAPFLAAKSASHIWMGRAPPIV